MRLGVLLALALVACRHEESGRFTVTPHYLDDSTRVRIGVLRDGADGRCWLAMIARDGVALAGPVPCDAEEVSDE